MIYLLTPTGGRPEGLALLANYINEQTYNGPATWVVVDDCDPVTPIPEMREGITVEQVRPEWRWKGKNTQARCLLAGLKRVPDDAVLFILEDDDALLPPYVETMLGALESADLVGEGSARYYNARTRKYKTMITPAHSSLASTAMRGTEALKKVCQTRVKFIDLILWRTFQGTKRLLPSNLVIGIKGLPGRQGIGVGHRDHFGRPDESGILEQWIGAERAKAYERFAEKPDRIKATGTA